MTKGKLIVGASADRADMLYATGFMAPDPFIYFERGAFRAMIVSALEYDRARNQAKRKVRVLESADFVGTGGEKDRTRAILREIVRRYPVDMWETPADFPLRHADFLREIGAKIQAVDGAFFSRRAQKSQAEIREIRKALRVAEKAMKAAETILSEATADRSGALRWNARTLTSEILIGEIQVEIVRRGATATGTIAACGPDSAEPHNAGHGPLRAGQPIVIDIFPRLEVGGYWGDITRTFVKGKAPDIVQRAYRAVLAARDKAKRGVKSGAIPQDLHQAARLSMEKAGFKTERRGDRHVGFFHGLGHGVGLEIHEAPRVGEQNATPLRDGEVVTVEPGLYYPEWGGVRLEDMVVVRDDGNELLTEYPDRLELP